MIHSIVFSPDGTLLASASLDGTIKLWSMPDGLLLKTLTGHRGFVYTLAISPDGTLLASGSLNQIFLWDLNGALLKTLTDPTLKEELPFDSNWVDFVCSCNAVCTCDSICTCDTITTTSCGYWFPN